MKRLVSLLVRKTYCKICAHARTSHSREGCVECPCTVKYMDTGMFE